MTYTFETSGTCSRIIVIETNDADGTIANVGFIGGCHGNLQGIAALVQGMKPQDVISRLKDIRCGNKPTSCPHQLSLALSKIINAENSDA